MVGRSETVLVLPRSSEMITRRWHADPRLGKKDIAFETTTCVHSSKMSGQISRVKNLLPIRIVQLGRCRQSPVFAGQRTSQSQSKVRIPDELLVQAVDGHGSDSRIAHGCKESLLREGGSVGILA